jgi:CHAT domain-containing protein
LAAVIGQQTNIIIVPDGKLHLCHSTHCGIRRELRPRIPHRHIRAIRHRASPAAASSGSRVDFNEFGRRGWRDLLRNSLRQDTSERTAADFFDLDAATFPPLPGSEQEVQSIGNIISGSKEILLEADATETAFKALPLENFRIVHLAVHGIANAQFPDRAALILGTSPTSNDDGLLQVREIRDLSLRADLVVLSACETGSGKLLGEEGSASLERAFSSPAPNPLLPASGPPTTSSPSL